MKEITPAQAEARARYAEGINRIFEKRAAMKQHVQKITAEQKAEVIRRRYEGEDPKDLALEFGITAGYIRNLAPANRRDAWA
jgi:DNA-directed RNA polymerase specialized sigma24 family protein